MWKSIPLVLIAVAASAQTQQNPFEKAPGNVDENLRARVNEFYEYFLQSKYRKAEQLVAEESKDGFYAAGKPDMKKFRLGQIIYSDDFTKAKVEVIATMLLANFVMGMADANKTVDVPFPSYWKIEEGKWSWYINKNAALVTPFGKAKPDNGAAGNNDPAAPFRPVDLSAVLNAVKTDRPSVTLKRTLGDEQKVTITNGLPGNATLGLDFGTDPGLSAKLDHTELKPGEKAVLTLKTVQSAAYKPREIIVTVAPTNQVIRIPVSW